MPDERLRKRTLIICPHGDVCACMQQGVIECLMEQPVDRPGISAVGIRRHIGSGFHEKVGRGRPGESDQILNAQMHPVDGLHGQPPQSSGKPRRLSECQGSQCVSCREPGNRADPLQVGGQGRVHRSRDPSCPAAAAFSSCRPCDLAIRPAMRKFCPDIAAIRAASGPATRLIGVGVVRAFVTS